MDLMDLKHLSQDYNNRDFIPTIIDDFYRRNYERTKDNLDLIDFESYLECYGFCSECEKPFHGQDLDDNMFCNECINKLKIERQSQE